MYPNLRPEIARVAEQTVVNLKELEGRIEVLKNDLAALCIQVGHPEAARLAATPVQWLGASSLTAQTLAGNLGAFQGISPMGAPFAQSPPFAQNTPFPQNAPFAQSPFSGVASPFGASSAPFGISPFGSPFQAFGPSPFAQTQLPYQQGTPLTTIR